jgi:hypothetical protein
MADPLDELPLDVLLALRDALGDPSEEGRKRAAQRAADAGFHIACVGGSAVRPIEMEPAPDGVEALHLRFRHG